jgi:signal transduction histidine kinase
MRPQPAPHPRPVHDGGSSVSLSPVSNDMALNRAVEAFQVETGMDIAHELRTSLAIITLVSGNLEILYDRLDDDRRRKMISDIRRQTKRLDGIITELLALCDEQEEEEEASN